MATYRSLTGDATMPAEQTFLELPDTMAERYMDTCFQHGPDAPETKAVRAELVSEPEWGPLFLEFADAVDKLKRAVMAKIKKTE
jgi:hypothetical protein